jgi:hypothetical protein
MESAINKRIFILCLIFGLSLNSFGQDFYDINTIHTIRLTFSQSNWDYLLDSLYAAGNEDRLVASVTIDGVQYDSVGVRYKGLGTYSPDRIKNPFNIKLDYVRSDQKIQSYGTVKLANVWYDPSFVREVLGYEIARKYMPAPLSNYANVYVNDTLYGLYTNDQDIDKYFMQTHFNSSGNARFKCEADKVVNASYVIWGYKGTVSANYVDEYTLESDAGWADLINFLDTLNNHTAAVYRVLNVDQHLWLLAYENLLVNLDSPINTAHNYYLYRDDSFRFNPIIWDLNMDFGGFPTVVGGGNLTLTEMQELTPFFNETNPFYPIINKILSNVTYKKKYIAHMKTILEENFADGWYLTRAQQLQALIDSSVQADTFKFNTYAGFLDNLNSTVARAPGIAELMSTRTGYVSSLPQFQLPAPVVSSVTHVPSEVPAYSTFTVRAAVSSATVVRLGYRLSASDRFYFVTMYDDGSNNDGAAGDGVYGVSLRAGVLDMHYYIYAENADAAVFAPPRAEYEDSLIAVTAPMVTSLVVNEFMADNATTQADQNGEYDDWIELYNPSSSAISLNGCHLSDKFSNPGKWTFPDTSIAANGYLVIWADEDGSQQGLHANFQLSKSGEAVIFSDADMRVIDSLTFGLQVTDISTGRCPNGGGTFVAMVPSFAQPNSCPATICGDANNDGSVDIADAVYLVNYIFAGGPAPDPLGAGDADCSDDINIADCIYLVIYIFEHGLNPCAGCK